MLSERDRYCKVKADEFRAILDEVTDKIIIDSIEDYLKDREEHKRDEKCLTILKMHKNLKQ